MKEETNVCITKVCSKCKENKKIEYFRYGRNKCISCQNTDAVDYRLKNREEIKRRNHDYYSKLPDCKKRKRNEFLTEEEIKNKNDKQREYTKWNPIRTMLSNAKNRSKQNGWECDISIDDIVIPDVCPVFGIKIDIHGIKDNRPSLDRIDNSKGYVKGNVRVISWRANRLKSDVTIDELKKILEYMEKVNDTPTST